MGDGCICNEPHKERERRCEFDAFRNEGDEDTQTRKPEHVCTHSSQLMPIPTSHPLKQFTTFNPLPLSTTPLSPSPSKNARP